MSNKRPYSHVKSTAATIDLIIDRVMTYLQEADCFLVMDANEDTMEFFRNEVRAAVTTVLDDKSIIFSLDLGDVNDKLDQLVVDWDRSQWPTKRKIEILETLYHSEEVMSSLDYYLEYEIQRAAGLLDNDY